MLAAKLSAGDQRQKNLLKSLSLFGSEPVEMNPHSVSSHNAHDRTPTHDEPHPL
jgi:hypothetical protein